MIMTAATDETITSISAARKRWDTMAPLEWRNKNKNKNKQKQNQKKQKNKKQKKKRKKKKKNKLTAVAAMSPALRLQSAMPVLPPLLPLHKHREQWWQQKDSSGSSRPAESMIFSAGAESIILSALVGNSNFWFKFLGPPS
jgi:hypothetical protein